MEIHECIDKINSKEDFVDFLQLLIEDFDNNKKEWENDNLEKYFSGMKGWIQDMVGYYQNNNKQMPNDINWQIIATILYSAKYYE